MWRAGQTGLLENNRRIFVFVLSVIYTLLSDVEKLLTTNYFTKNKKLAVFGKIYSSITVDSESVGFKAGKPSTKRVEQVCN